eukprot:GEMP01115784.1.p1 GENE.GEMP01115784.1~~GEMP01115784.1.p1  ORF type:complete len:108 (-),score=22.65 GEMP01115784.1:139-462(-)
MHRSASFASHTTNTRSVSNPIGQLTELSGVAPYRVIDQEVPIRLPREEWATSDICSRLWLLRRSQSHPSSWPLRWEHSSDVRACDDVHNINHNSADTHRITAFFFHQ